MANIGNITLAIILATQMAGAMVVKQGTSGKNIDNAITFMKNN